MDPVLHGTIAYPFADTTNPVGHESSSEPFVIKSAVGQAEYTIEIPGAARDYDIQIPLASMEALGDGSPEGMERRPNNLANPATTDRELVGQMPRLDRRNPSDTALLDSAFGVGPKDGPSQSPSYTLGISRINSYYKNRKFEFALIELNNLLAFYPTSTQLHKMKGTVLIKLQNYELAEKSWQRALDLSPQDPSLRSGLTRLQQRLNAMRKPKATESSDPLTPAPGDTQADEPLKQVPAPEQGVAH